MAFYRYMKNEYDQFSLQNGLEICYIAFMDQTVIWIVFAYLCKFGEMYETF